MKNTSPHARKSRVDKIKNSEAERYRLWIETALEDRKSEGKTRIGLAAHMGLAHSQASQIINGARALKINEIPLISEYLGVPPPPRQYPLVGDVGAGGIVTTIGWPGGEIEMVSGPDDLPFGTVAVTINGGSLGRGFDGWRAFYSDRREPFHEDWFENLCVVGTADGRILVKWVHRGDHGFALHSGTGEVEENVDITWAAKVSDLRPPR